MQIFDEIVYTEYIPEIGTNGLYSKRKPLVYKGLPIYGDLQDILSLLDVDTTKKYTSYIKSDVIRISKDTEILLNSLPNSKIKMIEIFKEMKYYSVSKKNYLEKFKKKKEYIFYLHEEYEDYANILYIIYTNRIDDIIDDLSDDDLKQLYYNSVNNSRESRSGSNILDIISGICYGYN